ncbi:MAG: hypothetical protein WBD64_08895 [Candidatus Zixiibacteriota bacterium]
MNEFLLRKTWKNDLFECIQQAGMEPSRFEWTEERTGYDESQDYLVSVIKYKGTDFYFTFDRSDDGAFVCKFSPGELELEIELGEAYYEWDEALLEFRQWLSRVKGEMGLDLWGQLKEYAPHETLIGTADISNAPLSYLEAEKIISALDKLRAQIEKNFGLQGEQLAFVDRQIGYLKEAAKRQGKKDWVHTSIGVIATISMGLALSPEKAKLLWDLVKSCFAVVLPLPAP